MPVSIGESRSAGRTAEAGLRSVVPGPPRLRLSRADAPATPGEAADESAPVRASDRDEFLALLLGSDDGAVTAFVDLLLRRGVSVGGIYMELLAPTAEALGGLWDDDACDFVDVTLAMGRLQRAVRELGHGFVGAAPLGAAAGRVLLSAMPHEQHTLGLFIVAEYLLRDGWHVRVLTPETSAELAGAMRDGWYDAVGFSTGCDSRLLALRHEIAAVRRHSRNPHVRVVVGGRIFVQHPDLVGRVGADGSAPSASAASECVRSLVLAQAG